MNHIRLRIRQAQRLQEAWAKSLRQRNAFDCSWGNAHRCWLNLTAIKRQIELAMKHGFRDALGSVHEDFRWKLDELSRSLQLLRNDDRLRVEEPTLADWFRELLALEDEFGNLSVDTKLGVAQVRTESITLKSVELGPFSIELHWSRLEHLKGSSCFLIVALEPNPASGRDDVTHPHVNDGELCAGDAALPIEKALAEGRLSEAFLMIRSVLSTYNPRSAYVQLDEWDGLSCGDCGGRIHRDNSSYCEGCRSDLCDGCASMCRSCEETRCAGCLSSCDGCSDLCCSRCLESIANGELLCSSCRGICSGCNKVMLQSELNDDGHCPECAKPEQQEPIPLSEETHVS